MLELSRGFGVIGREHRETDCVAHHAAMQGIVCNAFAADEPVESDGIQGGASAVARAAIRPGCSLVPATREAE